MSTNASVQVTKVSFPNQLVSISGLLFTPPNMDKTKKCAALAVSQPFGGVKEQTAGNYARKMAEKGYVTRIEEIAPRPILFIVGTNAATLFMSKPGYERAAQPKDWFEVPGATHHSLYDVDSDKAVLKLEEFFGRHLVPSDIERTRP
jgi:fermentation-respiration switch protein FrsA (DUF1100 family)